MTTIQSRSEFKHFASTLIRRPGVIDANAKLPEGLSLAFERVPEGCRRRWKMVLAREEFAPTTDEVELCCVVFRVPPSVTERHAERYIAHPKSGRRIHVHIVELTWHEDEEAEAHGELITQ
jgi:hypothetical protein